MKYISGTLQISAGLWLGIAGGESTAFSQQGKDSEIEQIVVTGSRTSGRRVEDSTAPVDFIFGDDLVNQGDGDLANLLRNSVPSFNVNIQPISDAGTIVRPVNLRGLPPDSVLVLLNGKRRHRSSVISFLGQGISDGAQGPGISVIPAIALQRVEVLRDGAAAQYGSDAIAGVINFVLKDDPDGGVVAVKYGSFYEGDGQKVQYEGNLGLPIGSEGFANISFELSQGEETSRSVQRDDAQALIAKGNPYVKSPAQTWGQPEVKEDVKVFVNLGYELSPQAEIYAFGNYGRRDVEGGFYYRNPETRSGVYSNDDGQTLLVGDINPDNNVNCPTDVSFDDSATLDLIYDNSTAVGQDCFAFSEMFPGGFTPRFGGVLNDSSVVLGLRGDIGDVRYDISASSGLNWIDFYMKNTVNASLGPASPNDFRPGGYAQREHQANIDLSFPVTLGFMHSDLNVGVGLEARQEVFEILAGDYESYAVGPLADQGFSVGSNGFPGITPEIEGRFTRDNQAIYLDVEGDFTEDLTLGAAIRAEEYDDFGSTTNAKLSFRYAIDPNIAIRSTASTGFRAPTPGQANITNITTVYESGELSNRGTIPPTNPLALLKGGKQLQPEKSVNYSAGTVLNFSKIMASIDYFQIQVTDRISQSASQTLTEEEAAQLESQGIAGASDISVFRFYTNAFDTTTQGVDVVINYPVQMLGGTTAVNLSGNWTETRVDSYQAGVLDEKRIRQLEDGLPNYRTALTGNHYNGDWRFMGRVNYYDGFYEAHLDDGSLAIESGEEVTLDAEVGVKTLQGISLAVGAQNLLNQYPDEHDYQGIAGAKYPETSPLGFNGGYYYTRLAYYF